MRIIALVLVFIAALAGAIAWTVWRADTAPVTKPLNAQQQGAEKLHKQLEETKQYEAGIEKQVWNSTDQLVKLIHWHQDRIEKLKNNSQAGEILAYDNDSVPRLQARINQLAAEEKAKELAAIEKAKQEALQQKSAEAGGAAAQKPEPANPEPVAPKK